MQSGAKPKGDVKRFTLPNGDGPDVTFEGKLLAGVSSHEEYGNRSKRWREISIYATVDGGYVEHSVGRSKAPDEVDRFTTHIFPSAEALFHHLVPTGSRPRYMIADLLDAVSAEDPAIEQVVADRLDVEDLPGPPGGEVFVLPRQDDRALRIRGTQLAHESSRFEDAPSWMEIAIYRLTDGRYVVWKAQRLVQSPEPKHAMVWIVPTGRLALASLIRSDSSWLEATAFDALDRAAKADPDFDRTLEGLLDNNQFRGLLPDVPPISPQKRSILQKLSIGARIVTEQDADGSSQRLLAWGGDISPSAADEWPLPVFKQFLTLSRQKLIRRNRAIVTAPGTAEWEISDLGRKALAATLPRNGQYGSTNQPPNGSPPD